MPWGFLWVVRWCSFGFSWFFWVRCLGSFVGCLLGVISVSRFCLWGFLLGFCSGFFWVCFGSPVYTSCVRRDALRFHFYKILLIKKKVITYTHICC
jgi:hypothetical protein